jgi:hypothetical protein
MIICFAMVLKRARTTNAWQEQPPSVTTASFATAWKCAMKLAMLAFLDLIQFAMMASSAMVWKPAAQ